MRFSRRSLLPACLAFAAALVPLRAADFAQQEPAGYSVSFDGAGTEEVFATATDAAGNVYVVGRFSSPEVITTVSRDLPDNSGSGTDIDRYRFGASQTMRTAGSSNSQHFLFVTKLNRDGQVVWQRTAGSGNPFNSAYTAATGVAADSNGNVFITGSYCGETHFGPLTVAINGKFEANIFVAMLDADGNWQWVKPFTPTFYSTDSSGQNGTSTDNVSYVYLRNGGTLPAGDFGNPGGAAGLRERGRPDGRALRLGPDGSIYLRATIEAGFVTFGGGGNISWMRTVGTGLAGVNRIALGQSRSGQSTTYVGTSFLTKLRAVPPPLGSPAGTATTYEWDWVAPVTSGVLSANSGSNAGQVTTIELGTQPNPGGQPGQYFGTTTSSVGDFTVDDDSVYLTGEWVGKNVLGNPSGGTTPQGVRDGYVARLRSSDGQSVYLSSYTLNLNATATANAGAIVVDGNRNAFVSGALFNNNATAATGLSARAVTAGGNLPAAFAVPPFYQNLFVAKFDPSGVLQWAQSPAIQAAGNPAGYAWAYSLARDTAGALYAGGGLSYAGDPDAVHILNFGTTAGFVRGGRSQGNGSGVAFVAKLTEDDSVTRTWRWVLQTQANFALTSTTPVMDTADVIAGFGGTIYWTVSSFLGGAPFALNRSPMAGDLALDTTAGRGAFLLPLLPDAPYLSPTFSYFNTVICGQEVPVPNGVYKDQNGRPSQPSVTLPGANNADGSAFFYWDSVAKKLYAISPILADVRWPISADPTDSGRLVRRHATRWPTNTAEGLTRHVTGAGANGDEPSVTLQPPSIAYTFATLLYQDSNAQVSGQKIFSAKQPGYAVLLYTVGANTSLGSAPVTLEVVRTRRWDDPNLSHTTTVPVGTAIDPAAFNHADPENRNGYVVYRKSRIDAAGATPTYNFDTRLGDIIPVNDNGSGADEKLFVIYSNLNSKGVAWAQRPETFAIQWPASPRKIIIASGLGSEVYGQPILSPATYANPTIYHQPDPAVAGYNPNEEHALFALPQGASTGAPPAVFALRNDLNNVGRTTSQPYVLVRYQDPAAALKPKFLVYKVEVTAPQATISGTAYPAYAFSSVPGLAGTRVQAPYPLSLLPDAPGTIGSGDPYFLDRKNAVWARSAGLLTARYFYPLQPGFWYDLNGDGVQDNVSAVPWLDRLAGGTPGTPMAVTFNITWPPDAATLAVGDTVTTQRNGLPDVESMASATVVFEENRPVPDANLNHFLVRIVPYMEERWVPLNGVVDGTDLVVGSATFPVELADGGRYKFANLPFHLKARLRFDPINKRLILTGYKDATNYAGRPLLLLNVLAAADKTRLLALASSNTAWTGAVG